MKKPPKFPKFKKGQVVKFGFSFCKIARVSRRMFAEPRYEMEGWGTWVTESDLRALTKRESGR